MCDVGPRDGLQSERLVLPVATRIDLVERLAAAGLERIEVASFVDPRRVPAMASAEEVARGIRRRAGTSYAGLVLNERGYDRFVTCRLDEIRFAFAVTDAFNRRNQGASTEGSAAVAARVVGRARAAGHRASVTLSAAFGCPFEGAVDPAGVLRLAERMVAAGAHEIIFADTIGVAVPRQIRELVTRGVELGRPVGIHLHNTRNTGYVNAWTALECGVATIDASIGGLGGCPFAPGATGNIATEDLLYLLHNEGVGMNIDLEQLIGVACWLERVMGKPLAGELHRAGVFHAGAAATSSSAKAA